MTVKIFLNQNNSCQFEQSDGVKDTMTAGSLVCRFESGRVRFSYSASGQVFRDYALAEIQDANGSAYASQALFEAALADFLIQTNTPVELLSHVCAGNSTSAPLGANETFVGEWEDSSKYGTVVVGVISDQNSATNGLVIEYSSNGVDVVQNDTYTILASNGKTFSEGWYENV